MSKIGFKSVVGGLMLASALTISGNALAAFEGFGNDIPLSSAASQIVPGNYAVEYDNGVDSSVAISWNSASDWQTALRNAVSKKGLTATIGTNTVIISKGRSAPAVPEARQPTSKPYSSSPEKAQTSKPRPRPQPAKAAPAPVEAPMQGGGGFSIRPYKGKEAPAVANAPAPVAKGEESRLATKGDFKPYNAAPVAQYNVAAGQMLRGVLSDWSAKAGWRVIWESEYDYIIEADASFSGDFITATTALREAMAAARPAITLDFHSGNNVVVVSNKSADAVN